MEKHFLTLQHNLTYSAATISICSPHLGGFKVSSATAALQGKVRGCFFGAVIGAILLGQGTEVEVEKGSEPAWSFAPALHSYMKHF